MALTQFMQRPAVMAAREVLRRVMPVVSLLIGVLGALLMDRSEEAVRRLGLFLTAGWLLGIAAVVVTTTEMMRQQEPPELRRKTGMIARWRRNAVYAFAERTAVQVCLSQALFFPLPAYLRSFAATPGQVAFLVVMGVACAVVLIDALFNRVYEMRRVFVVLLGFSGFVALRFALPVGVGLDLDRTLLVATVLAVLLSGVPAIVKEYQWGFQLRQQLVLWAMALVVAVALVHFELVGWTLPAVPLRVTEALVADAVKDGEPVGVSDVLYRDTKRPAPVTCVTTVRAPKALRDTLLHVWMRNGVEVERIAVPIAGGRAGGFRAHSTKARFGGSAAGAWRCELVTAGGQVLGGVDFAIRDKPPVLSKKKPAVKKRGKPVVIPKEASPRVVPIERDQPVLPDFDEPPGAGPSSSSP